MQTNQNRISSDSGVFSAFSSHFKCIRRTVSNSLFVKRMSVIALSDISFNEKIIRKYCRSNINSLPIMIFSNKKQSALSQITKMNFFVQFNFLSKIKEIIQQHMQFRIYPNSLTFAESSTISIVQKILKVNELPSTKIIKLWPGIIALGPVKAYTASSNGTINSQSLTYGVNLRTQNLDTIPIKSTVESMKIGLYPQNAGQYPSTQNIEKYQSMVYPPLDIRLIHVTTGQYLSILNTGQYPSTQNIKKNHSTAFLRKIIKINEPISLRTLVLRPDIIALRSGNAYNASSGTVNRHSFTYGHNLLIQNFDKLINNDIGEPVKTGLYTKNIKLLKIFNSNIYMQISRNFSSLLWMFNHPSMDLNQINVTNRQYTSIQNTEKHRPMTLIKSVFKSAKATLIEDNDKNNSLLFNKPVIKQDISKYSSNTPRFASLEKNYTFKENDNFYFQNNRKIKQALDQIKKIAVEVEETLAKKSTFEDSLHQVDITQISDKVYQMIDYRLKIEKERRSCF